ncbi:hypothetical protein [Sphingomonas solaris]|uniref:Uncharacterized protein n=1 Tax=Alterirhizorhabdus solaris TaxID=2529389 RepID=A0A558QSF5_9SPHN|nr:hypothetical protein [Sphingomonas solaris]TVV69992.1 hypothetical protein FOY91_20190 [Sphingomonas solaris]
MSFIFSLLEENHHFFKDYGPDSSIAATNPLSSAYAIWVARRLDTILPNNQKIISALNENKKMVPGEMKEAVLMFRDHASSYEQNAYDRLDHYRLFPMLFAKLVEKYKNE